MEDARYSAELVRARQRGVQIRVIFDTDELHDDPHGTRRFVLDQLENAGIPMRDKVSSGINHWKFMLFVAQETVQFSGANHTAQAFVPIEPWVNYVDEVIYFTDRPGIVNSFKTMFDDVWTSTSGMMADYANVTTLERAHATYPIDPEMNFAPFRSFRTRSVNAYRAETEGVDAIIYRITDRAHTDALIEAVARGVRVRVLTEPHQYRDESRLWHAWNVDRLYMAGLEHSVAGSPGAQIRHRGHPGLTHEKLTLLTGQGMTVFGSSNWTSASSDSQLEHNLFTTDPVFYAWSRDHFDRKWFNLGPAPESAAFEPLPPDTPQLKHPSNGATEQPLSVTLRWSPGPWAHRYDVYFGTDPASLVTVIEDVELGPYDKTFTAQGLAAGTTYYWKVVSRTMANLSRTSATRSFTTQGAPANNAPPSVTLTAPANGASYGAPANIALTASASDSDGSVTRVDFYAGTTLVGSSTSAPYAATWSSVPAGTYSLTARATDSSGLTATSSATLVTVSTGAATLPSPWAAQDIGPVGPSGRADVHGGTWTVSGSGADVWGTADAFQYVYQPLAGDGSIVARVVTVENVDVWTKAGVMIRERLTAGSKHASMMATPTASKGLAFQSRPATNGATVHADGGALVAPVWIRVTRTGSTISAYRSSNGSAWTLVGSQTIAMSGSVYVGLAVSSHVTGTIATATFDNVTVSQSGGATPNVPPTVALTAPGAGASFTAPATIALTAAASDSDGTIDRVEFRAGSTLVGTDAASPYAFTWDNVPAGSYNLTARAVDETGAATVSSVVSVTVHSGGTTPVPAPWTAQDIGVVGAPGHTSLNGSTWTIRGAGSDVWGTADAFHYVYQPLVGDGSIVARVLTVQNVHAWTKAGVMIRESLTPGSRHGFMIVTPGTTKGLAFQRRPQTSGASVHSDGGALAAPIWIRLTRSGSTVAAFRSSNGSNWTPVGSETIPMAASVYVGLAVSSHVGGSLATATFDNVTVSQGGGPVPPPNAPPTVAITGPSAGASFTAPATVGLAASAGDSDGTVSRVEFYAGTTHLGTDTTSPFSLTWTNVPAGPYSLTARAVDNGGAATVSPPVNIQVAGSEPASLPAGWVHGDVGGVGVAGGAEFANGAFLLEGAGADIWGTADAFQFAYRSMTGDGAIVARVISLSPTDPWTKAGVMIRAALTAASRHAMMVVSPGKGLAFQRRVVDGGESTHTSGGSGAAPVWVKLERQGSSITASVSSDGAAWTVVGTDVIDLPETVYVGLPLTSHHAGTLAEATISDVSVAP
jgi:regulation of enolase protein 1 (concanavalin A-like superfamily)